MTDQLVPLPDAVRALPAPDMIGDALKRELSTRVTAERSARGDVHQPEDTFALVRALDRAHGLLTEYAHQFSQAAALARKELDNELYAAVGDSDGVPNGPLVVPDGDRNIRLAPDHGNSHDIDTGQVTAVAVARALAITRDTEPVQRDDESDADYFDRYEVWLTGVIMTALRLVHSLGGFTMQVSKVRAFAAELAAQELDSLSAVVTGAIGTKRRYRGVKHERKERKS